MPKESNYPIIFNNKKIIDEILAYTRKDKYVSSEISYLDRLVFNERKKKAMEDLGLILSSAGYYPHPCWMVDLTKTNSLECYSPNNNVKVEIDFHADYNIEFTKDNISETYKYLITKSDIINKGLVWRKKSIDDKHVVKSKYSNNLPIYDIGYCELSSDDMLIKIGFPDGYYENNIYVALKQYLNKQGNILDLYKILVSYEPLINVSIMLNDDELIIEKLKLVKFAIARDEYKIIYNKGLWQVISPKRVISYDNGKLNISKYEINDKDVDFNELQKDLLNSQEALKLVRKKVNEVIDNEE